MTTQAIAIRESQAVAAPAMSVNEILAQVNLIQHVMEKVMHKDEHYGTIPGCGDKPTLLQPGAQKLLMTFRLAPEYDVQQTDLNGGHREYRVIATLKTIGSGGFVGQGVGCCSTMEGKYRFRVAPKELTDRPVPKAYWDLRQSDPKKAQELLGGKGFSTKKNEDGQWMIAEGSNEKVEHDNPADYYNTVLKMAKKRALVDATITATAASDIFTQDVEDMPEVIPQAEKPPQRTDAPPPAQPSPEPSKPAKSQPASAQAASDDVSEGNEVMLVDVKTFSGVKNGKEWTGYAGEFEHGGQKLEATTFSDTLGRQMQSLIGVVVDIKYKTGRKVGKFDLVSIVENDNVAF